ncbi:hypothetical protein Pfo_031271 [Paulownia fortunei]|nr:hypothetical protein Pfo_031271 [Paulownia fortunei]
MDQISSLNAKNVNCGSEQEHYTIGQPSMSEHTKVHNESMVDEFEHKLAVGSRIANPDDAYLFYCKYGRAKRFQCEKRETSRSAKNKQPIYLKMETRTSCTARLRIGCKKNEEWRVIIFVIEHNHDMVAADQIYMLRSAHNISFAKGDTLKALVDAGFSITNAYSYMQQESHGRENVGFLQKDVYDYLNRLAKDHRQVEGEILFYWDFQADENNRMCNFFFRDGQCRIDYEAFGDVLSFDTTYKTNKYNMICALFTDINHHMHNVMFGLAFMSDETKPFFNGCLIHFLNLWVANNLKQFSRIAIEIIFSDSSNRVQKVKFDTKSHELKCTCQYFESVGILYKHALLVFKQMNVYKIPLRYIKRRWTKSVRERVSFGEEYICASDHESEIVYVNNTMRFCYDLTMRSKINPDASNLVRNGLKSVLSNLNDLLDSLSMNDLTIYCDDIGLESFKARSLDVVEENNIIDDEHVRNPLYVKSKGRTTKGTKIKVQSSRIPKNAHLSQEYTNTLPSEGATSAQPLQYTNFQEISIGSQSSRHPPYWLYHMPSPTILVTLFFTTTTFSPAAAASDITTLRGRNGGLGSPSLPNYWNGFQTGSISGEEGNENEFETK